MAQIIEQHSPAIVTIKFLMKSRGRGPLGEQEAEMEAPGVMVDRGGLVLCANTQLAPLGGLQRMLSFTAPRAAMQTDIKDVRVVTGLEDEEQSAKILARDPDLDLAWVQIEKPKGEYAAIDLSKAAEPTIGEHLFGIHRLGKYFDRAPVAITAQVCGRASRPRDLWFTQEGLGEVLGLPLFAGDGKLVGIVVTQKPVLEGEPDPSQVMSMLSSMFSSMGGGNGIVLPVAEVVKATQRAKAGEITPEKADEESAVDKDKDKDGAGAKEKEEDDSQ